jgi:hypothetical protein
VRLPRDRAEPNDPATATTSDDTGRPGCRAARVVFLLRPELVDAWDFRVLLTVASQEVIRRARIRDAELYGSPDE